MDDNAKHAASYQADQEILEARGINMTVEEVAGLPTCKYSERVQSLRLSREDLMFLKGLRRRIKNRNSRRRSVEHLRRLTRELRAARAVRRDAIDERRALVIRRDTVRDKCATLRKHLVQILQSRSDSTAVPSIAVELPKNIKIRSDPQRNTPIPVCLIKDDLIKEELQFDEDEVLERMKQELQRGTANEPILKYKPTIKVETVKIEPGIKKVCDANIFECKIGKLVQQSVNHIFNDKKKVFAKTVFIANERSTADVKTIALDSKDEVLNLCVKEGRRKSHGRKQPAPRRITYCANDEGVLDLKIKKENQ